MASSAFQYQEKLQFRGCSCNFSQISNPNTEDPNSEAIKYNQQGFTPSSCRDPTLKIVHQKSRPRSRKLQLNSQQFKLATRDMFVIKTNSYKEIRHKDLLALANT